MQEENKITVKSNKTVYCTLYFDKKIAPKEFKFYIKEEKEEKYTKEITNIVHIEVEEDNVKEYCISEEETSEHCEWQELKEKSIDSEYTFTNETNEEKKVYAYVRNEYELDTQKEDKITFDNVAPVIENLTVENINSRSYKGTISNITDNLSGVDKHYFSNSGSNYTEEIVDNITYSGTKGASGAVYAYATDKAGNTGTIASNGTIDTDVMMGGMVGNNFGTLTINKSYNTGKIQCKGTTSSLTGVAGIVGFGKGTAFILNSYNTGSVTSVSTQAWGYTAGIGFVDYGGKLTVINSYNRGTISGGAMANAGIASTDAVSHGANTLRMYNVYNKATVTGTNANGIDWHATDTVYVNSYTYNNPATGQTFVNTLNTNKGKITLKSIDSSLSSYTLCNWKLGSDNYPALNC